METVSMSYEELDRVGVIERVIEKPGLYRLLVHWETLENHTEDFRNSQAFQDWRALVGPFFAAPPAVEHYTLLAKST